MVGVINSASKRKIYQLQEFHKAHVAFFSCNLNEFICNSFGLERHNLSARK